MISSLYKKRRNCLTKACYKTAIETEEEESKVLSVFFVTVILLVSLATCNDKCNVNGLESVRLSVCLFVCPTFF